MKCIQCGSMIEAGLNGRPPVSAKYCLKCRSERRRRRILKYKWTPEHDAYLREHYHGGLHQRGRVISALARATSFPRWYIKRHAQGLGLAMTADRRPWTREDTETLEGMLGRMSAKRIAKKLRRTETSVVMKIKALGTSRRVCEGYTMRDLATCLGEDHHKIQKWINAGWLRDTRQGTKRHIGTGGDIHRFREKDILQFLRNHPQEINLGKVEPTWFWDLVLLRGAAPQVRGKTKKLEAAITAQTHSICAMGSQGYRSVFVGQSESENP